MKLEKKKNFNFKTELPTIKETKKTLAELEFYVSIPHCYWLSKAGLEIMETLLL